jgi:hypothetical protein
MLVPAHDHGRNGRRDAWGAGNWIFFDIGAFQHATEVRDRHRWRAKPNAPISRKPRIVLPTMIIMGADNDMSIMMIGAMLPIIVILLAAVTGKIMPHRAVDGIAWLSRSSARRDAL